MAINFFNANISNSYIVWTYTYSRKNVISSKLTEAVRKNFKNIFEHLNFSISFYFRHKNFLSEHFKETHYIYRVSQEERTKLREGVPYVKLYRYNPKHLYPKFNGYGDNGKRNLKL